MIHFNSQYTNLTLLLVSWYVSDFFPYLTVTNQEKSCCCWGWVRFVEVLWPYQEKVVSFPPITSRESLQNILPADSVQIVQNEDCPAPRKHQTVNSKTTTRTLMLAWNEVFPTAVTERDKHDWKTWILKLPFKFWVCWPSIMGRDKVPVCMTIKHEHLLSGWSQIRRHFRESRLLLISFVGCIFYIYNS